MELVHVVLVGDSQEGGRVVDGRYGRAIGAVGEARGRGAEDITAGRSLPHAVQNGRCGHWRFMVHRLRRTKPRVYQEGAVRCQAAPWNVAVAVTRVSKSSSHRGERAASAYTLAVGAPLLVVRLLEWPRGHAAEDEVARRAGAAVDGTSARHDGGAVAIGNVREGRGAVAFTHGCVGGQGPRRGHACHSRCRRSRRHGRGVSGRSCIGGQGRGGKPPPLDPSSQHRLDQGHRLDAVAT